MRGEDDLHEGKRENLSICCEEKSRLVEFNAWWKKRGRLYLYGIKKKFGWLNLHDDLYLHCGENDK